VIGPSQKNGSSVSQTASSVASSSAPTTRSS
jgi:hypothetical protein